MGRDQLWERALLCTERALQSGALVPLATTLEDLPGEEATTFELRHLAGATPKHLREAGPSPILFDHGINGLRSIRSEKTMS